MGLSVTVVSDCHGRKPKDLLPGDLLLDCGDFTFRGTEREVVSHMEWLAEQPFRYIAFCAGNHELSFEEEKEYVRGWLKPYLSDRFFYLEDSFVMIDGFKVYGAPWQPRFGNWAFNVTRGSLWLYWDKIPNDTDILITHGPPRGYGDFVPEKYWTIDHVGQEVWVEGRRHEGCDELLLALQRVKPQVHCFGHFHSGYGKYEGTVSDGIEGVQLLNAAQCGENYQLVNKPLTFYLDNPKSAP